MEDLEKKIRSVLISTKGKVDLKTLQNDYQWLMGQKIPYHEFGYKKLEDCLRNCKTLSVTKGSSGDILVDAVPTEKSAHISSLVDKQKSTSKKKSKSSYRRAPPPRTPRQTQSNWVPASSARKSQPSYQPSSLFLAKNQNKDFNSKRVPPKLQRRGSGRNNRINHSAHVPLNPVSRAEISNRNRSEKHEKENRENKTPTPPPVMDNKENIEKLEIEKSVTSRLRLRRAISQTQSDFSTSNGNEAFQQAIADSEKKLQNINLSTSGTTRTRMRTQQSAPTTPMFSAPTSSTPVLFTSPQLPQSQIEELRRSALAAVNPDSSIWNWSSSDESTTRSGMNNFDTMSDKLQRPAETQNTLFSDLSLRSSTLLELKNFVTKHNLGEPSIKFSERVIKHTRGKILYDCVIKVLSHTYSSYPDDYFTKESAQMAAATLALNDLKEKYGKSKNLLIATERDILARIPPIIERHSQGVWANQIQLDYEQDYMEQLPSNWLKVLDSLPTISVEKNIENKYVLMHCKIGEKYKGQMNAALASEVSVPSNTVKITEERTVVQVTCALSTIEVWCREVFTPEAEAYAMMNEEMEQFYRTKAEHPLKINTGGFYVAYIDEMFCRVRALEVKGNDVMCFFIDFGDEYLIPKSQIYVLHRQFARQQAQAFVCKLGGLEELVNICSPVHLQQITGRTLHAEAIPTVSESEDDVVSVILFDIEEEVNINQELIKVITIDSTVVHLEKDVINKVYVSHADQNGTVYVQPCCDGYDKFMDLMSDLEGINFDTEVENAAESPEKLIASDQLYLTKWSEDDRYYRCKILDLSPDNIYAQIFFVDYGNEEIIKLENSKLFPLQLISDVLFWFPYQAIRVKINIDPKNLPENFPNKLQDILPNDQVALLKILSTDKEGIHHCDFFKRSAENILFSVNSTLLLENEIPESNTEDGNNNDRSTKLHEKLERLRNATILEDLSKKPVPSTGLLKAPNLPPVDGYFEVMIPFAVSPWNFFIQPYETAKELRKLMKELQEKYKDVQYSPVQIDDIIPGRIYASKHDDGFWYRTSVIKVINSGSISVFYCDFGYYNNLKIHQLVPLDEKFMELPFQALKAKLHGVKPKKSKWSMEDCKFFEQLVLKKTFASTIRDIQNDELYKYDLVLSLELIDTSSDKDVNLGELLIQKEIAIPEK